MGFYHEPKPAVPLERIRKASQQPAADIVWLQVAVEYIDQLLDYHGQQIKTQEGSSNEK